MMLSVSSLIVWFTIYPLGLYLMVDSGTDFMFRRPQGLLNLREKRWVDFEGNVLWLLLARFMTGLSIIALPFVGFQILLLSLLLLLEIFAGQRYLPKLKR